MDKAYLLPQYPYAADYGQVLLSALGGVDYADDRQYRENKAHKAQQYGAYEYQPPGYDCQYGIYDGADYAEGDACQRQHKALIGMIAGEGRVLCREEGYQQQGAKVGKYSHSLVFLCVPIVRPAAGAGYSGGRVGLPGLSLAGLSLFISGLGGPLCGQGCGCAAAVAEFCAGFKLCSAVSAKWHNIPP